MTTSLNLRAVYTPIGESDHGGQLLGAPPYCFQVEVNSIAFIFTTYEEALLCFTSYLSEA